MAFKVGIDSVKSVRCCPYVTIRAVTLLARLDVMEFIHVFDSMLAIAVPSQRWREPCNQSWNAGKHAPLQITRLPRSMKRNDGTAASLTQIAIALLAMVAIFSHVFLRFGLHLETAVMGWRAVDLPLLVALALGGVPLVFGLLLKLSRAEFGSDLLAGISIVTSVLLGEYLAGTLVVLMLSGGQTLEAYAIRSASSALDALAKRMPSVAHRKQNGTVEDASLDDIAVGDLLLILPHEICPIDGTVTEGRGVMDESYLTGEPYMMSKTPGSMVLSGAINGDSSLTVRADKLAVDSRYAKIMKVMESSQQNRPHIRRLGDQLGAFYTPLAVAIGIVAWIASGDPVRFLSVMVVATPCPLLIAIPVAIIGSISLAAKR